MDYTKTNRHNKKSTKKWITLIVLPFALLIFVALLQIIVHLNAASNGAADTGSPAVTISNIFSVLIGSLSVVAMLLMPVWIIMLVKTINYNATESHKLSKTAAVVFAVIFGFWAWLYTYERDKTKFWLNLILTIVTFTLWGVIAWIWAIIYMAGKPDEYFKLPKRESTNQR